MNWNVNIMVCIIDGDIFGLLELWLFFFFLGLILWRERINKIMSCMMLNVWFLKGLDFLRVKEEVISMLFWESSSCVFWSIGVESLDNLFNLFKRMIERWVVFMVGLVLRYFC